MDFQDLVWKRHAGHHHNYENAPFGYAVFVVVILNAASICLLSFLLSKYQYPPQTRHSRFMLTVRWLASISVFGQMLVWCVVMFVMLFVPFIPAYLAVPLEVRPEIWTGLIARFGRVGYALVPFSVFLAIKPNPLPRTLYLALLPLHKWLSRLIIVLVSVHGIGYLVKWAIEGHSSHIVHGKNFLGVLVWAAFVIVLVVSLRPVRRLFYNFFYSIHTVTAWMSLFLISVHARPQADLYTVVSLVLLLYSVFVKIRYSKTIRFAVKTHAGSTLQLVQFATADYVNRAKKQPENLAAELQHFTPGSHVRITGRLTHWKSWVFSSHPFTLASLPSDETSSLIVRRTTYELSDLRLYNVSIPFPAISSGFFTNADDVAIVCGGSGISFGLPIYQYFQSKQAKVQLIWITRHKQDLFVLQELGLVDSEGSIKPEFKNLDIFLTTFDDYSGELLDEFHADRLARHTNKSKETLGFIKDAFRRFSITSITQRSKNTTSNIQYLQLENNEETSTPSATKDSPTGETYELDTLQSSQIGESLSNFNFQKPEDEALEDGSPTPTGGIHKGRPDLVASLGQLIGQSEPAVSKWIVSCGPEELIKKCKDYAKTHKIGFISEKYSM